VGVLVDVDDGGPSVTEIFGDVDGSIVHILVVEHRFGCAARVAFWFRVDGDGHIYLSEDWAFCQRAKEAGFKLWVYPGIRVGHYGSYMYTLEDLIRPERPLPQPLKFDRQPNGNLDIQGFGYIAPEIYSLPADLASYL